jgi:predicted Ser/Thr protein kinase
MQSRKRLRKILPEIGQLPVDEGSFVQKGCPVQEQPFCVYAEADSLHMYGGS